MAKHIYRHVAVMGAGAWGTALAVQARRADRRVTVWTRNETVAASINRDHENPLYLPGCKLAADITATTAREDVAAADLLLVAVPAQHLRAELTAFRPFLSATAPLVLCCKGVEQQSFQLMDDVAAATLPNHTVALLSGPSFADEVARGLPTAVTLAIGNRDIGVAAAEALHDPGFRVYLTHDMAGVAVGGALKNVIAIAAGIVAGKKLGNNARAAVITRGLAEMMRYGKARGAEAATLMGLSGLGDLSLTCSSTQSRNMSLGVQLGEGMTLDAIVGPRRTVAEGVATATAVARHAAELDLEMPIAAAVDRVVRTGADIDTIIRNLMQRPLREESDAAPRAGENDREGKWPIG